MFSGSWLVRVLVRLEIQFLVFSPFTVVTVWQSVSPTPIFSKARLLQCLDFMFKNQILHRNSGFPTSLGKSEGLIMLGLEGHSLVCYSPRTHSLHSLTWSVQEAAGGEREGGPPSFCPAVVTAQHCGTVSTSGSGPGDALLTQGHHTPVHAFTEIILHWYQLLLE